MCCTRDTCSLALGAACTLGFSLPVHSGGGGIIKNSMGNDYGGHDSAGMSTAGVGVTDGSRARKMASWEDTDKNGSSSSIHVEWYLSRCQCESSGG